MNTLPIRKFSTLAAAATVLALLGTGTAAQASATAAPAAVKEAEQTQRAVQASVPYGKRAATHNPLYRTGRISTANCAAGTLRKGSSASYKRFMTKINTCLNNAWARQFRKARLPFAKPRLRFVTSKVSSPCGRWPTGAGGYYCSSNRTMYIGVTRKVVGQGFGLGSAQFMAHEYAHHVQTISKIGPNYYFPSFNRARGSAKLLLSRRFELQADCLASAFLRSVQGSLPVNSTEWQGMVDWTRKNGHKAWPKNDHGKGYSQASWMQRGFSSGGPGGCNTWTASLSRVA
ncbi:neutral zinc metallopeptidase [Spongiactinospora sp. TRM90649]|uniref:neutral zinc metallopeptidase n=1 Tax=Spongiactinospora sp. TRM90649 TaxID=3031114 RepID=UPI0023F81ACC|nr:neutral zinc metallopeptidase [Spongiactinospora sp. TRM90649]MDF5757922.1 neutral zinc metallopeptidase [Spongiactinospora sp. TRM90649]